MISKNPMTMRGALERCWLLAFQTPVHEAKRFLPPGLEPVTYGPYAFWNVVICRIRSMRPKLAPSWLGINYWHVGYRIYVRFHPRSGPPIEGLHFLRSDCDNRLIAAAGNLVTDFHFHTAKIVVTTEAEKTEIQVRSTDAPATIQLDRKPPVLSKSSPFDSLSSAALFLKYKPFGISAESSHSANIVRIAREEAAWKARLVNVVSEQWKFFEDKNVKLELCYEVEPISYQWNRGRVIEGVS